MNVEMPIMIEESKVVAPDPLDWIWEESIIETKWKASESTSIYLSHTPKSSVRTFNEAVKSAHENQANCNLFDKTRLQLLQSPRLKSS